MSQQQVQTPYGLFKSITDATTFIEIHHGPDFIKSHPNHSHTYNHEVLQHRRVRGGKGVNNSTRHYIYNVIKDLIGDKNNKVGSCGYRRI